MSFTVPRRTASRQIWFIGKRRYATEGHPIVHIPKSSIYQLGSGSSSTPLFRDVSWTIHPSDAWVVLSSGSSNLKSSLLNTLAGHLRISPAPPPPGGLFPFLHGRDPPDVVSLVSFAHRPRAAGGAFYDYTARYGAVREEDKRTLRDTFFPETAKPLDELAIPALHEHAHPSFTPLDERQQRLKQLLFEDLSEKLGLRQFLDLPLIALSNGQTRKARIIKALLDQPELLILDEPLSEYIFVVSARTVSDSPLSAGLDISTRSLVLSLLRALHVANKPHIILGMRPQDPIPDWTTHLALIRKDGTVLTGPKDHILGKADRDGVTYSAVHLVQSSQQEAPRATTDDHSGALVHMAGVNVAYGDRKVCNYSL